MNNLKTYRSIFSFILLFIFISNIINGQATIDNKVKSDADSLSLKSIIEKIIAGHPSVKAAEEAINNADARIGLAKTGYYPTADATASFANLGPVTKLKFPGLGTFQLYPGNNYSAQINYSQLVYDFGRTKKTLTLKMRTK
jgi:outer membrane protein TolC